MAAINGYDIAGGLFDFLGGIPVVGGLFSGIGDRLHEYGQREYQSDEREASQGFQSNEAYLARLFQQDERVASQQWSEDMWRTQFNMTNAYNTPNEQMKRMIAAGINPNTAALSINGGMAQAGATPAVSEPSASMAGAASGQSAPPAQATTLAMSEVAKNAKEAELAEAEKKKVTNEAEILTIDKEYRPYLNEANLGSLYSGIELSRANGRLSDEQAKQVREMLPLLKGKTVEEIGNLLEASKQMAADTERLKEEANVLRQQIEVERARVRLMNAEEREAYWNSEASRHSIGVMGRQMSLYEAEEQLKKTEARAKSITNDYRSYYLENFDIDPTLPAATQLWNFGRDTGLATMDVIKAFLSGSAPDSPGTTRWMDKKFAKWREERGIDVLPSNDPDLAPSIPLDPDLKRNQVR